MRIQLGSLFTLAILPLAWIGCSLTNSLDDLKGEPVVDLGGSGGLAGSGGDTGGVGGTPGSGGTGGISGSGGSAGAAGTGGSGGLVSQTAEAPFKDIAAGSSHACVIDSKDDVYCWGSNAFGQLGRAMPPDTFIPLHVAGLTGAKLLAAGNFHSCAITDSDTFCWGQGTQGQLGTGMNASSNSPVKVELQGALIDNFASGADHTCAAVGTSKTLFCWGSNVEFQSGQGTPTNLTKPTAYGASLATITAIGTGASHSCAVASGTLKCWGSNAKGQLGVPGASGTSPVEPGVNNVTHLAGGAQYTCARRQAGAVDCWGDNSLGQLGNGTQSTSEPSPVTVMDGGNPLSASSIAAGEDHTCAISSDQVVCWGDNARGQLGGTGSSTSPRAVPGLTNLKAFAVAVGIDFSCALMGPSAATAADSIYCWGKNGAGQAGNANPNEDVRTPGQLMLQ